MNAQQIPEIHQQEGAMKNLQRFVNILLHPPYSIAELCNIVLAPLAPELRYGTWLWQSIMESGRSVLEITGRTNIPLERLRNLICGDVITTGEAQRLAVVFGASEELLV